MKCFCSVMVAFAREEVFPGSELPWAGQSLFPLFVWAPSSHLGPAAGSVHSSDADTKDKSVVPHAPFLYFPQPRLYARPFFKEGILTDRSCVPSHCSGMSSMKHGKPEFAWRFSAQQQSPSAKSRWWKESLLMKNGIKITLMLLMNYA